MTIGPVQLLVLGFERPEAHGEIADEFQRLRNSDTVAIIDALVVYKDAEGNAAAREGSQLTDDEKVEFGATVGGLIGLGLDGEAGMVAGAEAGAEAAAAGGQVFSDDDAWDVLAEIPNDSAAAMILLEHRWAIPLRDAVARAGGFPISDGFIHPLDLVAVGLLSAEEAKGLETGKK